MTVSTLLIAVMFLKSSIVQMPGQHQPLPVLSLQYLSRHCLSLSTFDYGVRTVRLEASVVCKSAGGSIQVCS